ncbi:hypothetical protein [Acidianus sp. RZ1]|uniref:hypothetical protein n=1 Tax=Acidianus sp. RZ1 TaxID=1540082 RepID=UPI001492EF0A|nr:hypothetical protein [Acidianus sp. RZ1]NON62665.1 hypothetical protein [Acidianus sp. RZ1]
MDIRKISKDADEVATKILSLTTRKDMGVFYLVWSVYFPIIGVVQLILHIFLGSSYIYPISVSLVELAIAVPLIFLTSKMFVRTKVEYLRYKYPGFKVGRIAIILPILVSTFFALIIGSTIAGASKFSLIVYFSSYYALILVLGLRVFSKVLFKFKMTDTKFYDILAFVALLALPVGELILWWFYVIFLLTWSLAGFMSLRDSGVIHGLS